MEFKQDLESKLSKQLKQKITLELPPNTFFGDYALPCFKLKKDPKEILKLIIPPKFISKTEIKGQYINFFLNKEIHSKEVLKTNLRGIKFKKTNKKYMIEFSQANTHKAFHVGHVRGTSLGESISRILEFTGNKVIRANYQGDTGSHVSKWLWCYLKYHKNENPPQNNPEKWIASIYTEAVKKVAENPTFQGEVEKITLDIENNTNPELTKIWKKSRNWSLKEFEKIYKDLNTHFDVYFFERDQEKEARKLAPELEKKKIANRDEGALIVDLKKENMGVFVLLRKDNTCLYSIKDIALAHKKFKKFKINKSIYIIGSAQSLHMQQVFKTLELMKFSHIKDCLHIPFTEVRLPTGKMSSRTGENVLYSEMKEELSKEARTQLLKRYNNWSKNKIEKLTKEIVVGALKFTMLSQDPNKIIIYDPKKALEIEGNTGPYLQYTYARACSIIKKLKQTKKPKNYILSKKEEIALIDAIASFPEIIKNAALFLRPNLIANYAISLSQAFNTFYHACPVIQERDENLKQVRIEIVKALKQILKNSLFLLGMDAPERV